MIKIACEVKLNCQKQAVCTTNSFSVTIHPRHMVTKVALTLAQWYMYTVAT